MRIDRDINVFLEDGDPQPTFVELCGPGMIGRSEVYNADHIRIIDSDGGVHFIKNRGGEAKCELLLLI